MARMGKRPIWLFIIMLLFVFSPNSLFSQEVTETPIAPTPPTFTITPQSSPTSTLFPPTYTPTFVSTSTPTPFPILTTTATILPTETAIPTTTASSELSTTTPVVTSTQSIVEITPEVTPIIVQTNTPLVAQPEPVLTEFLNDSFLTDTNSNWLLGSGWQFIPFNEGFALQGMDTTGTVTFTQQIFTDVVVEAAVQTSDQVTFELYLRQSEIGSYRLTISPDGTVTIFRGEIVLASTTVSNTLPNQWRQIRFSTIGYTLRVAINGVEILVTTDTQPLLEGAIAFDGIETSLATSQSVLVDDVAIWTPVGGTVIPTPTLQPNVATPSPTATNTPTAQPTLAAVSSNYRMVYFDNFLEISNEAWGIQPSWGIIFSNGQRWLQINSDFTNVLLQDAIYYNTEAEMRFAISDGAVSLSIRNSVNGNYRVVINNLGQIILYRGSLIIGTGTVSALNATAHILGLQTQGNAITVSVDNVDVLTVVDTQPLPAGMIGFGSEGAYGFYLSDISVSVEETELLQSTNTISQSITVPLIPAATSDTSRNFNPMVANANVTMASQYDNSALFVRNGDIWRVNLDNCSSSCPETQLTNVGDIYDVAWSPDRQSIAFVKDDPGTVGNAGIPYVMPTPATSASSATAEVISYRYVHGGLAWSNDGTMIAIGSAGVISVINYANCTGTVGPICGGSNVPFAFSQPNVVNVTYDSSQGIQNNDPAWQPDDTSIIYTHDAFGDNNSNRALRRVNLAFNAGGTTVIGGYSPQTLVSDASYDSHSATASQHGIVFVTTDGGANNLRLWDYATYTHKPINLGGIPASYPSWSSSGNELAFHALNSNNIRVFNFLDLTETATEYTGTSESRTSTGLGYNHLVWGIPIGGGGTGNPTPTPTAPPTETPVPTPTPDPSPPGIVISLPPIVFTNNSSGNSEIYKAGLLSFTRLTNNAFEDTNPSYSTNGLQIAFQSYRNSNWGIYVMEGNGGNEILVANGIEPDWYPNSASIVYASGTNLFRINANGTGQQTLTTYGPSDPEVHNPVVSNSGNWIAFERGSSLYVLDATCISSCTAIPMLADGAAITQIDSPFSWSPSNTQMTLSINNDIYTANVTYASGTPQLTNLTPLTDANSPQIDSNPTWSPDGQTLYFESNRDGVTSLYEYTFGGTVSASTTTTFKLPAQAQQTSVPPSGANQAAGNTQNTDPAQNPVTAGDGSLGVVCEGLITVSTSSANIRSTPTSAGELLGSVLNGSKVDILGRFYNTDFQPGPFGVWYLIREGEVDGWVLGTLIEIEPESQPEPPLIPCVDAPWLDYQGLRLPAPPEKDPDFCNGLPLESEALLDNPAEAFINIRDYPSVSIGNVLESFGPWGSIGDHVQVLGRFTAGTPETWDDWYKVTYIGAPVDIEHMWVSAQYTTLSPGYNLPPCQQIPVFTENTQTGDWIEEAPFTFPAQPSPIAAASALYQNAIDFHLPSPFSNIPVLESDDVVFELAQGYGLNTFAYQNPNYYEGTNHIHSGLDFGGTDTQSTCLNSDPRCIRVVPICDGLVIANIGSAGSGTGAGITIRCFTPEGSLSNIYVTYNHLEDTENLAGQVVEVGMEYGLNAYPYGDNTYPHLHLEVFFDRDGKIDDGLRMNPLLFFDQVTYADISVELEPYYPAVGSSVGVERFEWPTADDDDPVGIDPDNLDYVQPFSIMVFLEWYHGGPRFNANQEAFADLDLGIQFGSITPFTILADRRGFVRGDDAFCSDYVWGRNDQLIIFGFQTDPPDSCNPNGIPGLQSFGDEPQDPYNGLETLDERWITMAPTLFNLMQNQDR